MSYLLLSTIPIHSFITIIEICMIFLCLIGNLVNYIDTCIFIYLKISPMSRIILIVFVLIAVYCEAPQTIMDVGL